MPKSARMVKIRWSQSSPGARGAEEGQNAGGVGWVVGWVGQRNEAQSDRASWYIMFCFNGRYIIWVFTKDCRRGRCGWELTCVSAATPGSGGAGSLRPQNQLITSPISPVSNLNLRPPG